MSDLLPIGIHFGLSEDLYHADPGLGSTSIKELASKPCKWQYDRLRGPEEKEDKHLIWGSAWHCRVLEGKDAFDRRYASPPRPDDYPTALNTMEEIKEFLRMHGQKLSGSKPELIARAKELDECPLFFDDILARWHADHPNFVSLKGRQAQEIEDAVDNMKRDPTLAAVMQAGSLINGAAEISIIWIDSNGIRRKARLDYGLAPAGTRVKSLIVDLKSFASFKGGTDEEAAVRKVYDMGYDIQVASYMEGYRAAGKLLDEGKVYGEAPSPEYLKAFLDADGVDWVWVMMRKDNAMVPVTLSIDTEDKIFVHARRIVEDALETYRRYMVEFGPDKLWTPPPKVPLRLTSSHLPSYDRGIQYEQPNHR